MKHCILLTCLVLMASITVTAEVQTILSPAEPPVVRRLQLQERWRIDAEDPEAPLLGYFDQSQVVARDNRVYLLDRQLCHILVYSDDGELLDTILREGDGPGEVRNPGAMFLCSDGRIAIQHGYPSKLEFIDPDGTPRGRWQLQANAWINRIQETSVGWYAVYQESIQSDDPGAFTTILHVALHDDKGQRTGEFHSEQQQRHHQQSGRTDEADEHLPWYTAVAVGNDDVVFVPSRDEY